MSDKKMDVDHIPTTDEMRVYVESRKMAQLKALFKEQHQKDQAQRMFYYYAPSERYPDKRIGDEHIVFHSPEYLAVRATYGFSNRHDRYYHAVWILGVDDGGVWIHKLQHQLEFEDNNFQWSKEYIRRQMGFTYSVDEQATMKKGEAIRIQGDLVVKLFAEWEEYIEQHIKRETHNEKERYASRIDDEILNDCAEYKEKRELIEEDKRTAKQIQGSVISALPEKRKRMFKDVLNQIKSKYEIHLDSKCDVAYQLSIRQDILKERYIDQLRNETNFEFNRDIYLQNYRIKIREEFVNAIASKTHQVNFRTGNHVMIISRGIRQEVPRGSLTQRVLIAKSTKLYVIHDEHQNKSLTLPAGIYDFELLQRHFTDRR